MRMQLVQVGGGSRKRHRTAGRASPQAPGAESREASAVSHLRGKSCRAGPLVPPDGADGFSKGAPSASAAAGEASRRGPAGGGWGWGGKGGSAWRRNVHHPPSPKSQGVILANFSTLEIGLPGSCLNDKSHKIKPKIKQKQKPTPLLQKSGKHFPDNESSKKQKNTATSFKQVL